MSAESIRTSLCRTFCDGFSVETVPVGYAIATPFRAPDGDPIVFYARREADGWRLEDDGDYLACAAASGIPLESGTRAKVLDAILAEHGAVWDRETYQIRAAQIAPADVSGLSVRFVSALIRARDIALFSQERVASTFAEDAEEAILGALGGDYEAVGDNADMPADILLRPRRQGIGAEAAVYLVTESAKLMAALLRHHERKTGDPIVIALLETIDSARISHRYLAAAQNRGLPTPVYDASPVESVNRVRELIRLGAAGQMGAPAHRSCRDPWIPAPPPDLRREPRRDGATGQTAQLEARSRDQAVSR